MKVSIKDFSVDMELKINGMELDVSDNNWNHLGDLVVTKAQVIWCKGKTTRERGKKFRWKEFIKIMEKAKP